MIYWLLLNDGFQWILSGPSDACDRSQSVNFLYLTHYFCYIMIINKDDEKDNEYVSI